MDEVSIEYVFSKLLTMYHCRNCNLTVTNIKSITAVRPKKRIKSYPGTQENVYAKFYVNRKVKEQAEEPKPKKSKRVASFSDENVTGIPKKKPELKEEKTSKLSQSSQGSIFLKVSSSQTVHMNIHKEIRDMIESGQFPRAPLPDPFLCSQVSSQSDSTVSACSQESQLSGVTVVSLAEQEFIKSDYINPSQRCKIIQEE